MATVHEVSVILSRALDEPPAALEGLMPEVYAELRQLAEYHMRAERKGHTLQPTALVNEAYLKLLRQSRVRWKGRAHLLGVAAQAMRRILVDHARGRHREKRGGKVENLPLEDALDRPISIAGISTADILDLEDALVALQAEEPRKAEVVELMYFGGLTAEEISELLGVTSRTVERDWRYARAWLFERLSVDEQR